MQFLVFNQPGNGPLQAIVVVANSEMMEDDDRISEPDDVPPILEGEYRLFTTNDDARVEFIHKGSFGFTVEAKAGGNLLCQAFPPSAERVKLGVDRPINSIVARQSGTAVQLSPKQNGERVIVDRVVDVYAERQVAGLAQ